MRVLPPPRGGAALAAGQDQDRHAVRLRRPRPRLLRLLGSHLLGVRAGRCLHTAHLAGRRPTRAPASTRRATLKPGDLVIFYGDLHHVGLYAGNGQVLHAPQTGAVVRYESMGDMPFQFGVRI